MFHTLFQWHLEVIGLTMLTRLGRGPGRQSALEAVRSSSIWQHANVCKWRGPAMTPAHRRTGPCPSRQRTHKEENTQQSCTSEAAFTHVFFLKKKNFSFAFTSTNHILTFGTQFFFSLNKHLIVWHTHLYYSTVTQSATFMIFDQLSDHQSQERFSVGEI